MTWEQMADKLAGRLQNHAHMCPESILLESGIRIWTHSDPEKYPDCPFCKDTVTYLEYLRFKRSKQ